MNRTQRALLIGLLLVAGLVAVLALRNPQAPFLPHDEEHARFVDGEACLVCHGPDSGLPRSTNHPIGNDCLRCHGRP